MENAYFIPWRTMTLEDASPELIYGEDLEFDYVDLCNQVILNYLQEVM